MIVCIISCIELKSTYDIICIYLSTIFLMYSQKIFEKKNIYTLSFENKIIKSGMNGNILILRMIL